MRSGSFVLGAIVLGLIAVAVLVWADLIDISRFTKPQGSAVPSSTIAEEDWVSRMKQEATSEGVVATFSDGDITSWTITDGHRIERFRLTGPSQAFARLASGHPLNAEDRLSGLQLKLPAAWAAKVNGKKIEVGVVARQPQTNAASDISILYATLQTGNSGWHTFKLTPSFGVSKFVFDVPQLDGGYTAQPLVILRGDALGGDRSVELLGVYLKPVAN